MKNEDQGTEMEEIILGSNGDKIANAANYITPIRGNDVENGIKPKNKICYFIFYFLLLIALITLAFIIPILKNMPKIDNNIEKNKGIISLITDGKNITIKKNLLKGIKNFISCIGPPGSGKSTFGSNYYKKLYKVKNNYFEPSGGYLTHTKGIWMISDEERRKITEYTYKDILDVEGFQVDDSKSWKYVIIIAFLSTDLVVLNGNSRWEDVKKMMKIIENGLKRMQKMKIPSILKNIYFLADKKDEISVEKLLEILDCDKETFKMIKFQKLYLPYNHERRGTDLLEYSEYSYNFENILEILNATEKHYNSVSSLINHIDMFNEALNGYTLFNSQTILEDIKLDFNGIYNRNEHKLKNELYQKIPNSLRKIDNVNETFEDFINKQINLTFEFDIDNEEYTFYGVSQSYNDIYEELKKNKTFEVDPKDIFYDYFKTEILKLQAKENKEKEEIYNEYEEKKRKINKYFAVLKFNQTIQEIMDYLLIEIDNDQKEFKKMLENELKNYYYNKIEEKDKEWKDQIERAKWKMPVMCYGEMKCKNGHDLKDDPLICGKCKKGYVYWVDSDEKYVVCSHCNEVMKLTENIKCFECGAEALCKIKWIKGYKP